MVYDERIEIRLKGTTKKNLEKMAAIERRKPSEMGRMLLENALDSEPQSGVK